MSLAPRHVARLAVLAPLAVTAAVSGCSKKPEPKTAVDAPASASAAPAVAPTAAAPVRKPATPTETGVHIDDAILRACGIAAPRAYFAFDSAHLMPEATEPLVAVAKCFASGPLAGKTLRLVGHADPRGESEYNFALGHSRADSVAAFIVSNGLDKARAQSTSRGELDATGTDESGWAQDRRVDLVLGP